MRICNLFSEPKTIGIVPNSSQCLLALLILILYLIIENIKKKNSLSKISVYFSMNSSMWLSL